MLRLSIALATMLALSVPAMAKTSKSTTRRFTEWSQAAMAGTCIVIGAPPVNTDIMCAGTAIMEDGCGSVADGESC